MTRLGSGPTVFAVEDDRAQVVWRSLPRGEVDLSVGRPYNLTDLQSAYLAVAVPRSGLAR